MYFTDIHKAVLDCMSETVYVVDRSMNILYTNPASERMTGYTFNESVGKKCLDVFCERSELCEGRCPPKRAMREHVPILHRDAETRTKGGDIRQTQISFSPFYENQECVGAVIVIKDITEMKRAEEHIRRQNRFFETVINALPHPFVVMDPKNYNVTLANKAAYNGDLANNIACYELSHQSSAPCSSEDHPCPVEEVKRSGGSVTVEHVHFDSGGHCRNVEVHCFPIVDDEGNIVQIGEYSIDITEHKRMEEELRILSVRDELTGLYNRRGFLTLAEHQLKSADRAKTGLFMLYTDLDNLKIINDTFGHLEGDRSLVQVAEVLRETFRNSDIIARIGGDEFVVFPVGVTLNDAEAIRARLQKGLDILNSTKNVGRELSLSAGIAYYDPECPCSLEELLIKGDQSMYEHKRKKKSHSRPERSNSPERTEPESP